MNQNNQMHIVHTEASQGWGGQEIRILTEAKGMMERGYQITLLCPSSSKIYSAAQKMGIQTCAMPYEKKTWKGVNASRKWLKENQPDVVNTHSSIDSWLMGIARIGLKPKVGMVRTRHISAPIGKNFISRWLYQRAADHVATTGEKLRQYILDRLGLSATHVTSVPTGIDINRFNQKHCKHQSQIREELKIPQDALVIGIAATLRSWKGHDYLLEAFAKLADTDKRLHLLIAGDGPRKEVIKKWISHSSLGNRIHTIGHRDDVPDILAAMDIFALPSYANEGVPQAILQAMSMQLPIVSTNVGAIEEAVIEGETGLIVPPKDEEALAEALQQLIASEAMAQEMGDQGRKRIKNQFSLEHMLDDMERIFKAVCPKY